MPIIEDNCEFHPEKEAFKKCEKCDKKICIECVKNLKIDQWNTRHGVGTRLDVCPICYYDYYLNKSQANNICSFLILIGFIGIPAFFFRNAPSSMVPFLTLWFSIPSLLLLYGLYLTFIKVPRDRKSAKIMKEQFLESLQNDDEEEDEEDADYEEEDGDFDLKDHESVKNSIAKNPNELTQDESPHSELKSCQFCGKLINIDAYACTFCGKIVSTNNNHLFCQQCGAANPIDRYTCQNAVGV